MGETIIDVIKDRCAEIFSRLPDIVVLDVYEYLLRKSNAN
jgi:hypothetical protein